MPESLSASLDLALDPAFSSAAAELCVEYRAELSIERPDEAEALERRLALDPSLSERLGETLMRCSQAISWGTYAIPLSLEPALLPLKALVDSDPALARAALDYFESIRAETLADALPSGSDLAFRQGLIDRSFSFLFGSESS